MRTLLCATTILGLFMKTDPSIEALAASDLAPEFFDQVAKRLLHIVIKWKATDARERESSDGKTTLQVLEALGVALWSTALATTRPGYRDPNLEGLKDYFAVVVEVLKNQGFATLPRSLSGVYVG